MGDGLPVPALVLRNVDFVVWQQVWHVAQKPRHRLPVNQLKSDVDIPAALDLVRRPVGVIGKRIRRRFIDDLRGQLVGVRQRVGQRGEHRAPMLALKHLTGQPIAVCFLRDFALFQLLSEFRLVALEFPDKLVELALHVNLRTAVCQADALHKRRDLLIRPFMRLVSHPLTAFLLLSSACDALRIYPLCSQRASSTLKQAALFPFPHAHKARIVDLIAGNKNGHALPRCPVEESLMIKDFV